MKRCVPRWRWLLLLLAASSLHGGPTKLRPRLVPTPFSCGWQGAFRARESNAWLERETKHASLQATPTTQCTRALQKAGADLALIQSLGRLSISPDRKSAASAPSACSSPAAQIAALVHDKKFDDAEDKPDPGSASIDDSDTEPSVGPYPVTPRPMTLCRMIAASLCPRNHHLRRQNRFDEALDEFTRSARLMPGFPETHSQLSYLFYRTDDSDNALAEARTALSIDPANAEAYRYLGLALYADGHYRDAALHAFDEGARCASPPDRQPMPKRLLRHGESRNAIKGDLRRAAIRLSSCPQPAS